MTQEQAAESIAKATGRCDLFQEIMASEMASTQTKAEVLAIWQQGIKRRAVVQNPATGGWE